MAASALVGLGALLVGAAGTAVPATAPAGLGPSDFSVFDYRVDLTIDREHRSVAGRERLRLRSATGGLTTVVFPLNGIEVRSGTTDRGAAGSTRLADGQLELRLPRALVRGEELGLVVDYAAREPKGVVFHPDAVYSVFHTCHWMVCRDRPDDKATFTLAIALPAGLTMVANGAPVKGGEWREPVP